MKFPSKIALVGAGGISCALLPMLCRLTNVVVIDEDNYEPKNSSRQFPALKSKGNKAKVLTEMLAPTTIQKLEFIPKYVRDISITGERAWNGVEMIVGAVDNNASRKILFNLGDALGLPVICAGNEHKHGDAFMQLPGIFYPEDHFAFDLPKVDDTPWACNSDENLEANPQTAIANIMAAAAAMHLLLSYQEAENLMHAMVYSRLDTFYSEYKRALDFERKNSII